ncbi:MULTISPECIES: DUF4278 domain-containing protein [unclassified Moorena]|uniref:DUF4278 domain-containing protein n=1 Tax=unclassified Moorena TaxID=2683338 RepID=UPI0013B9C14C|nr:MULTISPECIES: DUF4278 domain-containing protein [unclassified Moorena]NEP31832.1 DUF4278 domain-containing protein [Moorena sp. SIO3B2]NEP70140.1 DUF4278 domain-containing protein [Moorena sp. SIO3A5]NEQ06300.1 DUF4278 domain-containing protein [Moorena sp. SIO4E2]NER90645.1 DUF4278 domain-containing protein [Moorena sp. SIO3A2]NET67555.1 DUF4278 domain-containing protein [Moorena sp. SIO1G6]
MKLSYRGVSYQHHPCEVSTTAVDFAGKYRGLNYRLGSAHPLTLVQDKVNLKYRGVSY